MVGFLLVDRTTTKVCCRDQHCCSSYVGCVLRPIVWTNSSVIFTAHATQPLVTARLFPSSKQFVLPSPEPILTSPASYEPPAVISVSPHDDWLFAYFPGREIGGTGCLWKRGLQVDSWNIKDYWGFTRGGGAVTAAWLGTEREVSVKCVIMVWFELNCYLCSG